MLILRRAGRVCPDDFWTIERIRLAPCPCLARNDNLIWHTWQIVPDRRKVVYNGETKFTIQNKLGSIDDVIVGRRASCIGILDGNNELVATQIDLRTR